MTQEEKQLLLIDLCDRLPYGVKIHIDFEEIGHIVGDATLDSIKTVTGQFDFVDFEQDFKNGDCLPIGGLCENKLLRIDEFKPYLRSMSSMTEDEKDDLHDWGWVCEENNIYSDGSSDANGFYQNYQKDIQDVTWLINWLNSHHFDFRGLIEKGLALEAAEGMYRL